MQRITISQRAAVLRCLVEGCSLATTTRITGAAKNTIQRVLAESAEACEDHHDRHAVGLLCESVQMDEQWSYYACKADHVAQSKRKIGGDIWCSTAMCADSKFIISWIVGTRDTDDANDLCSDLAYRLGNSPQINADGWSAYCTAVRRFLPDCDFGRMVKKYKEIKGRLEVVAVNKIAERGNPDMDLLSTSFMERQNLTSRMTNRRLTRSTNGYSKKAQNHSNMLSLMYFSYNYCRKHMSLKQTPAQAIKVADHQWSFEEVAQMAERFMEAKAERQFEQMFRLKYELP